MSTSALVSPLPGDRGWLDGRAWQEANHDETGVNREPAWRAGATPGWHEDHAHYRRLRDEHARALDEDYSVWRRQRFGDEFERWRASERREPIAAEHESALGTFGRAIAETVSGSGTFEPEIPGRRER